MSKVVRIQGLVRLAEAIRREIGGGVGPDRRRELQKQVDRSIAQIDQILSEHRAKPGALAAPSRRAYAFLKGIRWEDVPEAQTAAALPAQATLRWTGLGPMVDRIAARLSGDVSQTELAEIHGVIQKTSRRIEQSIARSGVGPEHLTPATRDLRGWFAWMAEAENLREYLGAVGRARTAFAPVVKSAQITIEFRPSRLIYRLRTLGERAKVTLPTAMISFDEQGFADLAALISRRDHDARRRLEERMRADAYQDLAEDLEGLSGVVEGTRGAFHDLAQSFDRVNQAYFEGGMARPRLTWSRSFTGRKFGHYDHVKNWVMVSSTLDRAQVPAFVVDYLMFHELLHKKHGVRWVNGRGHAHTREFYADEHRFERYQEADDWLNKLARG